MGRLLLPNQDFHAKRMKSVTMELLKGKEIATRLQALLRNRDHTSDDLGLDSARQLTRQILRIFTGTISELSSSEIAQIPSVDRAVKKASPAAGVKERRGCYKRRRTSDSWVTVSHTQEDGFVWRKYGQKVIMNSKHPRCYFRCTYKPEGCKATKQVQRTKDDDYQTTYYNHHTCTKTPQVLVVDSAGSMELMDPNLISFQSSENTPHQDPYSPNPMITDVSSQLVQQEGNARLSNQDLSSNEVKSTPEWVSSYCFDKTSLHMLDMDVNELGDIDYNSLYFD